MVFWLVLYFTSTTGPTTSMHVGNFPTMTECQNAGRDATVTYTGKGPVIIGQIFICVQANGTGTSPPP
jgi:hypothetical protein